MFQDQIAVAIEGARGGRHLDEISRLLWRGLSEGQISDEAAQGLAEKIHTRRALNATTAPHRPPQAATGRPVSIFPPRRPQKPPHRPQAIERRRRVAASGAVPPQIATRFTPAEIAVLSIIAAEVRARGRCDRCIDEIAARAGCSRSTAKNGIRTAARISIIRVTHRPRRGQKNLPNVIEITSPEWRAWVQKRGNHRAADRGQKDHPHVKHVDSYGDSARKNANYVANRCAHTHDSAQSKTTSSVKPEGNGEMGTMRQREDRCGSKESSKKTKF